MILINSSVLSKLIIIHCFVISSYSKYVYQIKNITVPVDHFSFTDKRSFSLRYLVNDSYWEPKHGPIFFYPGNEASIEAFVENTGFIWEAAIKFRALVVFGEHRFYGKSLPFGNLSFSESKYYGYLTSSQALADFVDLIYHLRNQESNAQTKMETLNPVIAIGGSYGGMLAAWMRMKYPAVIEGALASSAPIWYFSGMTPCDAFNRVLTSVYHSASKTCVENIRKSWDEINRFTTSRYGKKWITKSWKLCTPLSNTSDIDGLSSWLMDMYSAVGMVNYPYPTGFLMPLPANPVKKLCSHLNQTSMKGKQLLNALFKSASIYFNYTGSATCLPWQSSAWGDVGIDGWNIQTCMDMVMPFCANGKTDMFKKTDWSFAGFDSWCYSNYKLHPIENIAEKMYGGKNINAASNIIFSNGLLDPWSAGGVLHTTSRSITVVLMPEAAHHLDLRPENELDPTSVKQARNRYFKIFKRWIQRYYKKHNFVSEEYNAYLKSLN